jgi:antitoxin ParD1/3/4
MEMTSLNVSLPKELRDFIESEVEAGGYGTASEYVRELIRGARRRKAEDVLQQMLAAGLKSIDEGRGVEATPEFWRELRKKVGGKKSAA